MLNQVLSSPIWQTIGALITIVTATITIIAFIYKSHKSSTTKNVLSCITLLLTVALIGGTVWGIDVLSSPKSAGSTSTSNSPTPTSRSSETPTPTTTQASPMIEVPLGIEQPSGQKLSAALYFGQLGALLQKRADVGFSTDNNFAQQHGQLCVETVVVSNVSGNTAVVYDKRVSGPTNWGGAETAPPSDMTKTNHTAHQQLIIPPENMRVGMVYVSKAQVNIGQNVSAVTEPYRLALQSITSPRTQWDVQKSDGTDVGIVECNAWPS
jgi:hypothetical protein